MKKYCICTICLVSLVLSSCIMFSKIGIASTRETDNIYDASKKTLYPVAEKGTISFTYGDVNPQIETEGNNLSINAVMYENGTLEKKEIREILGTYIWNTYPVQLEGYIRFNDVKKYFLINANLQSLHTHGDIIDGFSLVRPALYYCTEYVQEKKIDGIKNTLQNDDRNSCPHDMMEILGEYRIQSCIANERFSETIRIIGATKKVIDSKPDYQFSIPFENFYRPDQKFQLYRTKDNMVLAEWSWNEWKIFAVQSTLTKERIKEYIALNQLYLEWYRLINSRPWYGLPKPKAGEFQAKRKVPGVYFTSQPKSK